MKTLIKRPIATPAPLIRIVVADVHPVVRFGVKSMLMNEPGFDVVGEAEDGDGAIQQALELEPDVLLLDLLMPRLPGLVAMRAIMMKSPRVKIILLTSTITTQQIIEALQIGARGIVLKDTVGGDLSQALRAVLQGDCWIGGERVANLLKALHELMQKAVVPERKTYELTRANWKSFSASSRAAATGTSPASSPSRKKQSNFISRISSTRPASPPAWNSPSSPSPAISSAQTENSHSGLFEPQQEERGVQPVGAAPP